MKVLTLHVETSDDGQTIYAELADARSLESQSLARKKAGL